MTELVKKEVCLLMEVLTSVNLLKKGMVELQKISGANDFYHAPILLLSSGYERLMKCLLCLALINEQGQFIETPFNIGRKGHDLIYLLDKLIELCKQKKYSSKFPAAKEDIDFISKDKELKEIISLLSGFAQGGRYYNLDVVISGKSDYQDPSLAWTDIETAILKNRKGNLIGYEEKHINDVYKEVNRELIIVLEKFARALARLFTLGDFGDLARQASPYVKDYLTISDEELGKRDYQEIRMS